MTLSHLTSRGLLLVGPGGCAAVGGGERGVWAGGHLAHLAGAEGNVDEMNASYQNETKVKVLVQSP